MRKLIPHTAGKPFIQLRQDFIEICEGDIAAAALLGLFEFWANGSPIDDPEEIWIEASLAKIEDALLGIRKARSIQDSLSYLEKRVFVERLTEPGKVCEWHLHVYNVQFALDALARDAPHAKTQGVPTQEKGGYPRKKAGGHSIEEGSIEEHTQQRVTQPLPTDAYDPDELREWLVIAYPRHRQRPAWIPKLCEVVTNAEIEERVRAGFCASMESDEWKRGIVPSLYKFLDERRFDAPPPPPQAPPDLCYSEADRIMKEMNL